jgi:signal transduction histidine kinase
VEILIVDDEENVLKVLSRILSEDYVVHVASSGKDALEILQNNPVISLIISDQRMPVMTGTEFLNRSITINPDCIRIILTGYTDVKDLIESINAGRVFQYITKPFEPDDLRIIVKRGVDFYFQSKELELAHAEVKQAYESLQNAQEQLIRSEKMSMLGKLMGSIAHEIRNPINNIGNSTKLLTLEWKDVRGLLENIQAFVSGKIQADDLKKDVQDNLEIANVVRDFESAVDIINHSCDLVSEIIEDLRGFSRLDDAEFVQTDLHAQIERGLALLKAKFKHQVEFHKEFAAIPKIMGLPGPISQVIINILNNAAQAGGDHGKVWIRTSKHKDHVTVEIKDNGIGIPKLNLEKIFEPGFTTKDGDEGTGLGLTISQEIMKKHSGMIEVESEVGKGTTFKLTFPIIQN